jgi:hypothetical protein
MEVLFTHITDELQAGWIESYRYKNGNLALKLMTQEGAYATLSTNIEGVELDENSFIAKNYSENEGLLEQFIENGLFEDTGQRVSSAFVSCPILKCNC